MSDEEIRKLFLEGPLQKRNEELFDMDTEVKHIPLYDKRTDKYPHRNGVECIHGMFLHEMCPQCLKMRNNELESQIENLHDTIAVLQDVIGSGQTL